MISPQTARELRRCAPLGDGSTRAYNRNVAQARFKPTDFGGCVLWLDTNAGITTIDVAIGSPNDLQNAAWGKTGCTAPTVDTMQDTVDGAPTVHFVFQTILQQKHRAVFTAEYKADTLDQATVQIGDGTATVTFNITAGTVIGQAGADTVATFSFTPDGWTRVSIQGTSTSTGQSIVVGIVKGGLFNYQGDGTGRIRMRNASVVQRQLSDEKDQSGKTHDFSQAAPANQPGYQSDSFNGKSCLYTDGADDFLSSPDHADFDPGLGSFMIMAVLQVLNLAAFPCVFSKSSNADGANWRFLFNNTGTLRYNWGTDAQQYANSSFSVANGERHVVAWGLDSNAAQVIYVKDSTIERTNVVVSGTGSNALPVRIGQDNSGGLLANMRLAEAFAYNRGVGGAFQNSEISTMISYLRLKWGV